MRDRILGRCDGTKTRVSLDLKAIYGVNRTEIAKSLCIDLSEWDIVVFGKPFAILIFGDGFDKGAVEIPTFRLNGAPLRFDLGEVAP